MEYYSFSFAFFMVIAYSGRLRDCSLSGNRKAQSLKRALFTHSLGIVQLVSIFLSMNAFTVEVKEFTA